MIFLILATKACEVNLFKSDIKRIRNQAEQGIIRALTSFLERQIQLARVVQRLDNFIRWIRHSSASKIYFTLNVVQGFRTLPN